MNQTISMEERNRIENAVKCILPMTWDDKLGFDDIGMKVIGLLNDEVQRVSLMQEEVEYKDAVISGLRKVTANFKQTTESQAKALTGSQTFIQYAISKYDFAEQATIEIKDLLEQIDALLTDKELKPKI